MSLSFGLEFDEFEEAMRGVDGRYTPVRRHRHDWKMECLALGDIEIMRCQNGGGSIYEGSCRTHNFGLFFPLHEIESLVVDGSDIGKSTLTWLASSKDFHIYNSGVLRWVGISIGYDTVNRWLSLLAEPLPLRLHEHRIRDASPACLAALRDMVIRLFHVQKNAPNILASAHAHNESYEQLAWNIFDALRSLDEPPARAVGRPQVSRSDILRKATALLGMRLGDPVHVADLCKAAGVSSRTLHTVFVEHFGVPPHRYLMLKRLRAIHEALQQLGPSETIAEICGRFGIWDFGRFAGAYRRVYGVFPSSARCRKSVY